MKKLLIVLLISGVVLGASATCFKAPAAPATIFIAVAH